MSKIKLTTHLWIDTTKIANYPWSDSAFPFGYLVAEKDIYNINPDRVEYLLTKDELGDFTTYINDNFPEYLI